MSMSMPTLNVCTLSNIRVASNTHCFVAASPGISAAIVRQRTDTVLVRML